MSDITYTDKTQTDPYDPAKFNAEDANEIKNAVNSKVDEVTGKQLSTEDYTTTEKSKLAGIQAGATANDTNANLKNRANHTGTQNADTIVDGTINKVYTSTEKTKLNSIANGATANATDAQLRDRATHTGSQAISTVTGLQTALDSKQATLVSATNIKTVNGLSLLGSGDLPVGGAVEDGDKGDVVVTDDGTVWTVPDLEFKAPLDEEGKIPSEFFPLAPLDEEWFTNIGTNDEPSFTMNLVKLTNVVNNLVALALGQNETPVPPDYIADDFENTLRFTHALGESEILVSVNNASYVSYLSLTTVVGGQNVIAVGDVSRGAGYYKAKTRAATLRNESGIKNSPPFNSSAGTGNYIDGYTKLPYGFETPEGGGFIENPDGVFKSPSASNADNPSLTGQAFDMTSYLAMQAGSISARVGLIQGSQSVYIGMSIYIGFNNDGDAVYGTTDGETILSVQPSPDGFIAMKATAGNTFDIYVVEDGIFDVVATATLSYSFMDFNPKVKGTLGLAPTAVAYYPQGLNLTTI